MRAREPLTSEINTRGHHSLKAADEAITVPRHLTPSDSVREALRDYLAKPAAEKSSVWKSYLLYFQPGPVIELLRGFKRRSGGDLPISQRDLWNQMKTRSYRHPSKQKSGHRQKFNRSSKSCWGIKVNLHPRGLTIITDEEFDDRFVEDGEQNPLFTGENWLDLRKGDLIALVESLQNKPEGEN